MTIRPLHFHTLKNGLQIVGEPCGYNQSASLGFFVKTGARDEVGREAGLSHFLEHMMFKGTNRRSALDLTYEMGSIGAQANAFTSEENTVYYATVIPEYFSRMQEILSDMLRPSFDPDEFEMERKVILEEIALYQDRPQFCLFEQGLRAFFETHPAGNSVLGSPDTVGVVKREEMLNYFERRYSPDNLVLVAAGKFDWDEFVASAEKYCDHWQGSGGGRSQPPFIRSTGETTVFRKKDVNQAHLLLVSTGPSATDEERYPLSVLSTILGDGSGSKLYWDLVETGIAESAVTEVDEKDGTGTFMAYASVDPDRLDEVRERVGEILLRPMDFSDDELSRAVTKLCTRVVMSGELPIGRMMSIGNDLIYRGEVTSLANVAEKIRAVSREGIKRALEKFPLRQWCEYRLLSV